MRYHQNRAVPLFGDVGQYRHDRVTVDRIERSSGFVCKHDRWISHDGARDCDTLLLAAAELTRKRLQLGREANPRQHLLRLRDRLGPVLAAYIEGKLHIFSSRERRKQMIRLEHEPDMAAPDGRELFGAYADDGFAAHARDSGRRRKHAAEDREQCGFSTAGWPDQHGQFAGSDRQVDSSQSLDACRPAAVDLADVGSFDNRRHYRVSTIAGSTRTTRTMDASAETMPITRVRPNRAITRFGVNTI